MIYIFKLLEKNLNGTFNLGGRSKISIFSLAKIISKKVNANFILPKKNNSVPGAPKSVNISIKKLNNVYKFKLINLINGLDKTIKWYKFLLKS